MKISKMKLILTAIILTFLITSCEHNKPKEKETVKKEADFTVMDNSKMGHDKRTSLKLNSMQKNHQLTIMRDHLDAVQTIVTLLSNDKFEEASKTAYTRLGSTTKMKLMCASFGDKKFENIGLEFHKSADKMSEIFKTKDKNKSLKAVAHTMNYCVQCHATYRQ